MTNAQKLMVTPLEPIAPMDERYITEQLLGKTVFAGKEFSVPYFGSNCEFRVVETIPNGSVTVFEGTKTQFVKLISKELNDCLNRMNERMKGILHDLYNELKSNKDENVDQILIKYASELYKIKSAKQLAKGIFNKKGEIPIDYEY